MNNTNIDTNNTNIDTNNITFYNMNYVIDAVITFSSFSLKEESNSF